MEICQERFFLITKDIFDIENYLSLCIPDYKQVIDGSGDSYKLKVRRDSMLDTRRFEYPYVWLNTPLSAKSILDVGGGATSFCFYTAERVKEYTMLDIDPNIGKELEVIQSHTRRFHNVSFKLGSALDIPYPDESFDCTYCISVLEHVGKAPEIIRGLQEMRRVTRKGGVVIATFDVRLGESKEINMDDVYLVADEMKLTMDKFDITKAILKTFDVGGVFTVACVVMTR